MFDISRLINNRRKTAKNIRHSPFYQFINNDIIHRLEPINCNWSKILLITLEPKSFYIFFQEKLPEGKLVTASIIDLDAVQGEFDLIIFPFGLHWINNVPGFLLHIKQKLADTGFFISNFSGGGSLMNLRKTLINLEVKYRQGNHIPHISPFIQFNQANYLFEQAGFKENIIDIEKLVLEYQSPLDLMHAIKNHGEANALSNQPGYSITKDMYRSLSKQEESDNFTDHINLITILAGKTARNIRLKTTSP